MKKIAVSLIALTVISGAAFAADGADNNVPAFDHNPGSNVSTEIESADTSALADVAVESGSDIPNYINRSQLR
jgi:hypothetical protein